MKKAFKFDKLVRDKIYEDMLAHKVTVKLKDVSQKKELLRYFKQKIIEEANEVISAESITDITEEMADLIETIYGFADALQITPMAIEKIRNKKAINRGTFTQHRVIDYICINNDLPTVQYLQNNPEKYPEIDISDTIQCSKD